MKKQHIAPAGMSCGRSHRICGSIFNKNRKQRAGSNRDFPGFIYSRADRKGNTKEGPEVAGKGNRKPDRGDYPKIQSLHQKKQEEVHFAQDSIKTGR